MSNLFEDEHVKLLDKWKDYVTNITNYLYEFPNKFRVLISDNKITTDFDLSIIVRGGSYYENQAGVPYGTSHFLEHVIFGNPNKRFKTKTALNEYPYGNKYKPSFQDNAYTSREFVYYYANGHHKAALRIVKYLFAKFNFPLENIPKYLEKEREIILNEIHERTPDDKTSWIQYEKFLWETTYPEFTGHVLGSEDSLKAITSQDLISYYRKVYTAENLLITIQCNGNKVNKSVFNELSKSIKNIENKNSILKQEIKTFIPDFKYKHFYQFDAQSINITLSLYYKLNREIDYTDDRLHLFFSSLLEKVGNDYLREEKNLVYGVRPLNDANLFIWKNRGLSMECRQEHFKEVLEHTYFLLFKYTPKFLRSNEGERWMNNIVSYYIFKQNQNFDPSYAESLGVSILNKKFYDYKFDYRKAKKAAFELKVEDLLEFYNKQINIEPIFWFESPFRSEQIIKIFEESKFYKKFNTTTNHEYKI